jgi:DNA end-binding protein Ku
MAATVWKGHVTFGLVSIPVRLFRAARPQRVKLRQLYRPSQPAPLEGELEEDVDRAADYTGAPFAAEEAKREPEPAVAPVRRVYQDATRSHQGPIEQPNLVKGFEYDKGQYVVLSEADIRSLAPQTSTQLEIVQFVHFGEVDPVYLETSYYVAPDRNGEKPYALLFEAMRKTGYAAVGQLTMHRRDHIVILRPGRNGLIAHTMFYADEVRTVEEFRTDTSLVQPKELNLAEALVQALAKPFEPEQFKNAFREKLRELIDARAAGRQVASVEQPSEAPVIDIMAALERSLAAAKTSAHRKPAVAERAGDKKQGRRKESKRG